MGRSTMRTRCGQVAQVTNPSFDPSTLAIEGSFARIETHVKHMECDIAEIKAMLNRMERQVEEMREAVIAKWREVGMPNIGHP